MRLTRVRTARRPAMDPKEAARLVLSGLKAYEAALLGSAEAGGLDMVRRDIERWSAIAEPPQASDELERFSVPLH